MHHDLHVFEHLDHGLPRDAVQEGVGLGGMHFAILDEENIGPRRLGHIAAVVVHHGIRTALCHRRVLGHGANHIQTRSLGRRRNRFGRGALPLGNVQFRAFELRVAVVSAPSPAGNRQPHRIGKGRNAHLVTRAAKRNCAHIGVGQTIGFQHFHLGRVDLGGGVRDRHIKQFARHQKPLGMLGRFEDLAVIAPLAFKHSTGIVQRMGQNMHLGIAPFYQFAIHPDEPVAIVISCHLSLHLCKCCGD